MDMGDACGGPGRMDGKDGDGENSLGKQGKDCGGYKAGDRNSPHDDMNLDPPCNGMDGSGDKADYNDGDGVGKNGNLENDNGADGDDGDSDNERDSAGYKGSCLPNRPKRRFLPSQTQAMALLSMAVPPEDRAAFEDRFRSFKTGIAKPSCPPRLELCAGQVLIGLWVHIAAILPFNLIPRRTCSHPLG